MASRHILGTDRNAAAVARLEAQGGEGATLESLMQRADIVIATTGVKGLIRPQWVRPGQVILALSNPDPEIEPLVAREHGAAFAADGKGINNLLAFPGLFKGALEANARRFSDGMLMAAADTIAGLARGDELVPDPLDKLLHEAVAAAVRAAAAGAAGALRHGADRAPPAIRRPTHDPRRACLATESAPTSAHLSPCSGRRIGALAIPLWAMWPSLALRTAAVPPLESLTLVFLCGFRSASRRCTSCVRKPGAAGNILARLDSGIGLCRRTFRRRRLLPPGHAPHAGGPGEPSGLPVAGHDRRHRALRSGCFGLQRGNSSGLRSGFQARLILYLGRPRLPGSRAASRSRCSVARCGQPTASSACCGRSRPALSWRAAAASRCCCAPDCTALRAHGAPRCACRDGHGDCGFVALGLGNFLWDQGFRRGDSHLLAVMAYATPLCSALLLTVLGAAILTWNLLLGALVIVAAGLLSRRGHRHCRGTRAPG